MGATYVYSGSRINYTPSTDVASRDVIVLGDLIAVATEDISAGVLGTLAVEGAWSFDKATGSGTEIEVGALVYYDDSHDVATTTAGSNKLIGKCIQHAAAADDTVLVRMTQ